MKMVTSEEYIEAQNYFIGWPPPGDRIKRVIWKPNNNTIWESNSESYQVLAQSNLIPKKPAMAGI